MTEELTLFDAGKLMYEEGKYFLASNKCIYRIKNGSLEFFEKGAWSKSTQGVVTLLGFTFQEVEEPIPSLGDKIVMFNGYNYVSVENLKKEIKTVLDDFTRLSKIHPHVSDLDAIISLADARKIIHTHLWDGVKDA